MCGIVGVVGELPDQKTIEQARDTLKHRGPDDRGIYYKHSENIALGHTRLSIIDLSKNGHQPFFSNDERYVLVYNGEIYNYLELKKELRDFYDFKTNTDTEVLLASYIKWGKDCLDRFNGMFAFAIWDKEKKNLFIARDRLGIKPLFYSLLGNNLYFASEIKSLFELGIPKKVNQAAAFDFLYYGLCDHTEKTFFGNINQFPNGCYAFWQNGTLKLERYWDLIKTSSRSEGLSDQEIEEKFTNLLTDSIKLRLRSDVPVGINLSSGLDSNSLLYYIYQITGRRNIPTFSGCMDSEEYNECSLIEQYLTTEQKKFWHPCFFKPEEAFMLVDEMIKVQDQPFTGMIVALSMRYNSAARNKGIKVSFEGQGGDEILAGYKYYLAEYQKDLDGEEITDAISLYAYDMTLQLDHQILDKNFIKHYFNPFRLATPTDSHLLNAQYRDIMSLKLAKLLRFNEHSSMHYGLELRFPYLDYRLVEFCFWLPARFKIEGEKQKVLSRMAFNHILPESIKAKGKKAFGAIQVEWFRKYYKNEILDLLSSNSFKSREYWEYRELMKKIEKFFQGEGGNSFWLWQAIIMELWLRKFFD